MLPWLAWRLRRGRRWETLRSPLLQAGLDRGADFTDAYTGVIGVLAVGAACFAVATWWCFRDNPKSGGVNA